MIAYDPVAAAEGKLRAAIDVAWPAMERLIGRKTARPGKLSFTTELAEMAAADFIQEAAPEREDLKIRLFREIGETARPDVVIASSSSGFLPSRLQSQCPHPERVMIGHPFNPVYLLPLVEVVPGKATGERFMDEAAAFYTANGMHVLRLKKEIPGYICDRLQEALWREALHCLNKDVGSTGDIDDALIYSAGLRWAFMGSFLTYHLAGGPGGMRDFIRQFDPSLELAVDRPRLSQMERQAGAATDRGLRNPGGRPFGRRDRGQAQRGPGRPAAAAEATPDRRRPGTPARGGGQGQAPASQALEGRRQDRRADQIMERHRGRGLPRL